MAIVRLHTTQVIDPAIDLQCEVFRIPATTGGLLSGIPWDVESVQDPALICTIADSVMGRQSGPVEFDRRPLLNDLIAALAATVAVTREQVPIYTTYSQGETHVLGRPSGDRWWRVWACPAHLDGLTGLREFGLRRIAKGRG
jgi:hypothetical protein